MLRINSKNISIQLIMLMTLCLLFGLMMCLSLPPAYAALRRQQPYYVVDAYQSPGIVFKIENREPSVFFKRQLGNISSIALWRERLYFCSANDKKIYQRMGQRERVIFTHNTYIRDIAVDSGGNLYFSVANDARSNGTIYKLSPLVNELGSGQFSISHEEPIQVRLSTVDGFWGGDFIFDRQDNLYLSSGNRAPAFIYRVPREGSQYGSPRRMYRDTQGAIKGIAINPIRPNLAYYADWKQTIYRLDIRSLKRSVEYSGNITRSKNPRLSDVAFNITAQ